MKSNKAKASEGERKSQASLDEIEKLRQGLKERGAEAKSAKEQAEKLRKELEVVGKTRQGLEKKVAEQIDRFRKQGKSRPRTPIACKSKSKCRWILSEKYAGKNPNSQRSLTTRRPS